MSNSPVVPDNTAVRVALWRALHSMVDPPPHVLEDEVGLKLVAPDDGWRQRPDMDPNFTKQFRASIVARARYIEDLVAQQVARGVMQYVILGAGLDSFAQRRADICEHGLNVFEIDQPETQDWKRRRLVETGYGISQWLKLVPVDFEAHASWLDQLKASGFDEKLPAVVSSTGVSMYLTREANIETLRQVAGLAPGSTLAMTFIIPVELADASERPGREASERGARASGTPFISFFAPDEMKALALESGFKEAHCVSGAEQAERYFARRPDGLNPGTSEAMLVAST